MDGGGVRGLIPTIVLKRVEELIREKSGNPDLALTDVFDFFAGISTGSIITSLLLCPEDPDDPSSRPRYDASDAVEIYQKRGKEVFFASINHRFASLGGIAESRYPAIRLEEILQEYFGDLHLSQLLHPCLFAAYDMEKSVPVFFNKSRAALSQDYDFLLRDVIRGTTAAPTYFEPAKIHSLSGIPYTLVDGATFSNNPAQAAITEIASHKDEPLDYGKILMLSLGTGNISRSYVYEDIRRWGALSWALPIVEIMMSGVSRSIDFQLRELFRSSRNEKGYLRIDPILGYTTPSPSLDNVSDIHIEKLIEVSTKAVHEYDTMLKDFVNALLE